MLPINEQLLNGARVDSGAASSEADGLANAGQHILDAQGGRSSRVRFEDSGGPASVDDRPRALPASGSKREPVDQDYLQVLLDTEFGPPKFQVCMSENGPCVLLDIAGAGGACMHGGRGRFHASCGLSWCTIGTPPARPPLPEQVSKRCSALYP